MDRWRFRKVAALRYVLLLPTLLLVTAPAVASAAQPGKPKVDRLVMGLITPYLDYVRPWINGTADHNIQHDPMMEWLVEVDAETGQYKPWLAESWKLGPNARSWRVKLRPGVQFHHGYGEFTAQDVVHTIPLFDVYIEVIVDPKIIADWPFPGWDGGDVGHTWRIMACKQEKPCK